MSRLINRYFSVASAIVLCLALMPGFALATEGEKVTDPDCQPSWDPNDPASWTEDESPFYPDARIDMTPEEMLIFVKQIEDELGINSSSATEPEPDKSAGLSVQSVTLETANKLISAGCRYFGMPYLLGGRYVYQGGFDCTGFVIQCLYDAFGIDIDRAYTTADKLYDNYCIPVSAEDAKPGDLVFWRGTYGLDPNWISHVGIYCGGNIAFAASGSANAICFQDITKVRHIKGGYAPIVFGTVRTLDAGDVTNDYFEIVPADKIGQDGEAGEGNEVEGTEGGNNSENSDGDKKGETTLRERILMYRLYNTESGEHLFTSDMNERDTLALLGWVYEGIAWEAPEEGEEVYRLYNPSSGDHHYTTDANERDELDEIGWNYEGICWLSSGDKPVYRVFNPNEKIGTHHYTTSKEEYDNLIKIGWKGEDIGWYAR